MGTLGKETDKHLKAVDGTDSPGTDAGKGETADVAGGQSGLGEPAGHDRNDADSGEGRTRRGIYLMPNLITTGALFAGFYAIVAGMNQHYIPAALAMFVAMALDTADGRVARWTRTESQFGAEYDSLSDMVAFGVAPALVAFAWGLSSLGQIGWVVTFIYMACAALRLARFNTKGDSASFTGLPSPSAAAVVACAILVWADTATGEPTRFAAAVMAVVTLAAGLLMVSPFRYFSPKLFDFKSRVPFLTLVFVVFIFAVMLADPPRVLLVMSIGYALSGPLQAGWKRYRRRRAQKHAEAPEQP